MQQQPFGNPNQTLQNAHQTTGHIATLDNRRGYKPLRVSITEASGQTRWFSAFEGIGRSLEAGGVGSGPWILTYTEKPYVSAAGNQGVNLNIRQAVLNDPSPPPQPQPQPQPQPPVQQQAPAPTSATAAQYDPTAPAWTLNMDDRGRSIIRQVAFKAAVDLAVARGDASGHGVAAISDLTDALEAVIMGSYIEPPAENGSGDDFVEETF